MHDKRRQQLRHPLRHALPVLLHHKSLRREDVETVEGLLLDASEQGLGILVTEPVALASLCTLELCDEERPRRFQGEICYAKRTDYGIRLGIWVEDDDILGYLKSIGAQW
ncbi:PilZ domain-containing protein [Gallaecimonas kandeliae]|uniref:PilZ domain-containing protein n=1 Tax=Gallaecimonas kandeliae TaxID=3029055 RepID=UPI00264742BC|nr:PilZ domain-containing protein [Gallaecimonas kandeliae]WKE64587.1 PilZ domain-containing protein [Gallaecimonas kandeliae]